MVDPMPSQRAKRKLSAILSADVKGYSRLMGEDELATVDTLKKYRGVMATLIQQYKGRVVDSPGDNVLSEFPSVVDAVECAVKVQEELKARNAELPENRKMEFRIGVNLGDVIEDEDRLYGDGVNIAARVEGLAEGGGVCISGTAFDQVKNKLSLGYEYLGEHAVKNIAEPVRAYRVLMDPEDVGKVIGEKRATPARWVRAALAAGVVLVVGAVTLAIWKYYLHPASPPVEVASEEKMAFPLPDKPSIAVLPFKNFSADPEQEYFSDGITNDIITDLSKFREMFVIASNTVFTYKGKQVKIKDVSQELGVRYVLEGSVQKAGEKVRVNTQLIDATTGHHLWAERYERELKDLFAVQDQIVQTIVATLAVKIDAAERARVMRKDTKSMEAYDYLLHGLEYDRSRTRSGNIKARQMFEGAIELDPRYASAYVGLGTTYLNLPRYGWTEFPAQALQKAYDLAQKALSIDESNAGAHTLLGNVYRYQGQYDIAASEYQRAIELNSNDAPTLYSFGGLMLYSGRLDDAIPYLETALRMDPNMVEHLFLLLGLAYYLKGRYDDSIRTLGRGLGRKQKFVGLHLALAAAYAQSGRSEEAAREAAAVLRLHPFFEVDSYGSRFRNPADRASIVDGLRKAGLK
ncbi:tetratricopeptide repeat protein [Nitrospinae bacterium AH_259_B05_G02_I21]|nr:tetratricopeptide repeat protein [Nitrospinae bacterium AH_259_B05_G02_I21]